MVVGSSTRMSEQRTLLTNVCNLVVKKVSGILDFMRYDYRNEKNFGKRVLENVQIGCFPLH